MIAAEQFIQQLAVHGFDLFIGVPCSFLTPLINFVIEDERVDYMAVNNEGEAIAVATGAYLAGKKPVVMCQNSGLGNALNPLTSLADTFSIPFLLITTWRGQPTLQDAPQHRLMGQITPDLLTLLGLKLFDFPTDEAQIAPQIAAADHALKMTQRPVVFLMQKGSVASMVAPPNAIEALFPTRIEALQAVLDSAESNTLIIATTGKTGRELFTLQDRDTHFYMVGSMGCAVSIGLGVAQHQPDKHILVIDGDGAALMRLEGLVSVGHYRPKNLTHLLLDNAVHDSTGGQATLSASVNFANIARASNYATAQSITTISDLAQALTDAQQTAGPHFIHLPIAPGSLPKLGRPTLPMPQIARRFRHAIGEKNAAS